MSKVLVLLMALTSHAHAIDYFYCTNTKYDFSTANYLISNIGISFYQNDQQIYHRFFQDSQTDIFRKHHWDEELNGNAKIVASNVPSSYGEYFQVLFEEYENTNLHRSKLACKRSYRVIGHGRSVGRN